MTTPDDLTGEDISIAEFKDVFFTDDYTIWHDTKIVSRVEQATFSDGLPDNYKVSYDYPEYSVGVVSVNIKCFRVERWDVSSVRIKLHEMIDIADEKILKSLYRQLVSKGL